MKNDKTKLSTKEFLTLYTGAFFGMDVVYNAIDKIFEFSPDTQTLLYCAKQFGDYINKNRQDLVEAVMKVGVFDSKNIKQEEKVQALQIWLEKMEKALGKEIEVDKMLYKDESQPTSL